MKISQHISLFTLCLLLVGCIPAPSQLPSPNPTRPTVIAGASTLTPTAAPSPKPTSTPTLAPTPGPDLSFMYFVDDGIYEYDMATWSAHKVDIPTVGELSAAQWSPDQNWFAFRDGEGLKLLGAGQLSPRLIRAYDSETTRISFELGNRYLAYSDAIGLQIVDLLDQSVYTLIEIEPALYPEEATRFVPDQWSPDGEWLWVDIVYYEDQGRLLFYIPTHKGYDFSGCNWYIDWPQDSAFMLTSVSYSGISLCGYDDGVFQVDLRKDHSIKEKRIFHDSTGGNPESRATYDLRLSPDENQIVFIQVDNPDTKSELDHLMLMNADGSNPHELLASQSWLAQPIWSSDGSYIVYVVNEGQIHRVMRYSLMDGTSIELFSDTGYVELSNPIGGSDWMMIAINPLDLTVPEGLYLVNLETRQMIKIDNMDSIRIGQVR